MSDEDVITPRYLPARIQSIARKPRYTLPDHIESIDDTLASVEKQIICDTLR